jgi:glycine cleavage system H lipoate-binding protein
MDGFKYAKSHEYIKLEGDVATVGISDFAQVLQPIYIALAGP